MSPPPSLPEVESISRSAREAEDRLGRATSHLLDSQRNDGCWEGEMVWCTMILSQYVIVRHVTGRTWDEASRDKVILHYRTTRTPDGVWGLHPESSGYVFTTALAYVALRLLGLGPDHPLTAPARRWLRSRPDGVLSIPTWGKFWLALVGLYEYEGVHAVPPEAFLLPGWLPFHPLRFYCHTRYIYLAMGYLYGSRARFDLGPIRDALREELYEIPYGSVPFAAHRDTVAESDIYAKPGLGLRLVRLALSAYERRPPAVWRRRAQNVAFDRLLYEQRASRYQGLSPVNGLLNCLAILTRGREHPDLAPSLEGVERWRWEDDDEGLRYAGARSQTWDTALAVQALTSLPRGAGSASSELRRAYRFLGGAQATSELPDVGRQQREPIVGGWCFSDGTHRWPVSDCTAEALSALLAIHDTPGLEWLDTERIADERLRQGVEFLLARQNADGGFGTYERRRGPLWLDAFNPSEMYARCMTEMSYPECTGSALAALAHYLPVCPGPLQARVQRAVRRGVRFLRRYQRPDGSFPGTWGVNFTYGAFHAVRGLRVAGVPASDPQLRRAADWLVGTQRDDGSWGEHYHGCLTGRYTQHEEGQPVMTAWALLALMEVIGPHAGPVARGIAWLWGQQRPDGSWPQKAVTGVFFGTAMLDYRMYRSYFPLWALARHTAGADGAP